MNPINRLSTRISSIDLRDKTILLNIFMSFFVRGLSILVGLATMPLFVRYFKDNVILGVWFTLVSMLNWVIFFDFGIGNGLRNYLAKAIAQKKYKEAKYYISSAYIIPFFICVLACILIHQIHPLIPYSRFLNINENYEIVSKSILLLIFATILRFWLQNINFILYATQKSSWPNALMLISNILIMVYLLLVEPKNASTGLVSLSLFYSFAINIPLIVATIVVFSSSLKNCVPSFRYFSWKHTREVLSLGGVFFLMQIMALVIFNTNNLLISWLIGSEEVVEYQILFKLFSLVSSVSILFITPMWSAVTQAHADREYKWIKKILNKLYHILLLAIPAEMIVVLLAGFIINIWMGKQFIPQDYTKVILVAVSDLLFIWWNVNSYVANGLGKVKTQMVFAFLGAIAYFPLAYILVKLLQIGTNAILLANIICILPYCIAESFSLRSYIGSCIKRRDLSKRALISNVKT